MKKVLKPENVGNTTELSEHHQLEVKISKEEGNNLMVKDDGLYVGGVAATTEEPEEPHTSDFIASVRIPGFDSDEYHVDGIIGYKGVSGELIPRYNSLKDNRILIPEPELKGVYLFDAYDVDSGEADLSSRGTNGRFDANFIVSIFNRQVLDKDTFKAETQSTDYNIDADNYHVLAKVDIQYKVRLSLSSYSDNPMTAVLPFKDINGNPITGEVAGEFDVSPMRLIFPNNFAINGKRKQSDYPLANPGVLNGYGSRLSITLDSSLTQQLSNEADGSDGLFLTAATYDKVFKVSEVSATKLSIPYVGSNEIFIKTTLKGVYVGCPGYGTLDHDVSKLLNPATERGIDHKPTHKVTDTGDYKFPAVYNGLELSSGPIDAAGVVMVPSDFPSLNALFNVYNDVLGTNIYFDPTYVYPDHNLHLYIDYGIKDGNSITYIENVSNILSIPLNALKSKSNFETTDSDLLRQYMASYMTSDKNGESSEVQFTADSSLNDANIVQLHYTRDTARMGQHELVLTLADEYSNVPAVYNQDSAFYPYNQSFFKTLNIAWVVPDNLMSEVDYRGDKIVMRVRAKISQDASLTDELIQSYFTNPTSPVTTMLVNIKTEMIYDNVKVLGNEMASRSNTRSVVQLPNFGTLPFYYLINGVDAHNYDTRFIDETELPADD